MTQVFGHIDQVDTHHLIGWAYCHDDAGQPAVAVNGVAARILEAGIARPDVEQAGGVLASGFVAEIPPSEQDALTLKVVIHFPDHPDAQPLSFSLERAARPTASQTAGHVDYLDSHYVHGWLSSHSKPGLPIVTVNGFVAELRHERLERGDVAAAGHPPGCGFTALIPEATLGSAEYQVNLYHLDDERPKLVETSIRPRSETKHRKRAAVVCWDLAHNPAGRARVLVDVLERTYDEVDLIGPVHPRFGSSIWQPLAGSKLRTKTVRATSMDDLRRFAATLPRHYDVVWICKPRFPSLYLASVISTPGSRVILDIDDHEPSFFSQPLDANPDPNALQVELETAPFDACTTGIIDAHASAFPVVTVSNPALRAHFGGTIIRHARDERVFKPLDPALRQHARTKMGIAAADFVLVFVGTPRSHKGVHKLADLLQRDELKRRHVSLLVVGADQEFQRYITNNRYTSIICSPPIPFDALPGYLQLGDGVVLLQDAESPISRFQVPAKISDALATGLPVLVTDVPPVADLRDLPGVDFTQGERTLEDLVEFVSKKHDPALIHDTFLEHFSVRATAQTLEGLLDATPGTKWSNSRELLRSVVDDVLSRATPVRTRAKSRATPRTVNVVLLWKQNDLGHYGRRVDSIIGALERNERVGRILCIEAPCSATELERFLALSHVPQNDFRFRAPNVLGSHWRTRDSGKKLYRSFLYKADARARLGLQLPTRAEYRTYLKTWLEEALNEDSAPILWSFPTNYDFLDVYPLRRWSYVIADYIDDQTQFTVNMDTRRHIIENYMMIARYADRIVFNNERNLERALDRWLIDPKTTPEVIANCLDLHSMEEILRAPPPTDDSGKLVLGYVGNLQHRIDYALLEKIAQHCVERGWILELVGSGLPDAVSRRLREVGNTVLHGALPFRDAVQVMMGFTVGLLPHEHCGLTESMHPLKVYQYRACGLPVVAMRVANLPSLPGMTVCEDHEAFLAAVDRAVLEPRFPYVPDADGWDAYVESVLRGRDERVAGRWGRVDAPAKSERRGLHLELASVAARLAAGGK